MSAGLLTANPGGGCPPLRPSPIAEAISRALLAHLRIYGDTTDKPELRIFTFTAEAYRTLRALGYNRVETHQALRDLEDRGLVELGDAEVDEGIALAAFVKLPRRDER
jgi:hypothetical protein